MTALTPTCPYCGLSAIYSAGSAHLHGRDYGPVWECPPCSAWITCSPDGAPLGRLANAELRAAKVDAHQAFDNRNRAIMEREGIGRKAARTAGYKWLAAQLNMPRRECHISHFDTATCARVVRVCNQPTKESTSK